MNADGVVGHLHQVEAGPGEPAPADPADELELAGYCARPMCRSQFQQATGRGRPRDYCSDTCRRLADRDYKRARAMVSHFETLAERSRHDVAAFGRAREELEAAHPQPVPIAVTPTLAAAIARADAVLDFFSNQDDRLLGELRALRDAARGPEHDARRLR